MLRKNKMSKKHCIRAGQHLWLNPHLWCGYTLLLFCVLFSGFTTVSASADTGNTIINCGVGIGIRLATSPFVDPNSTDNSRLYDIVPLFYYEEDYLYIDGLEGGFKLLTTDQWQLRLMARWRFFDVPDEAYTDLVDTSVIDWGLAVHYQPQQLYLDLDLLVDGRQRLSANLQAGAELQTGPVSWQPHAGVRLKEARYNVQYYGLGKADIGGGMDLVGGLEVRYPLFSEWYLLASAEASWLGSAARSSMFVDEDFQASVFAGLSYENRKPTKTVSIAAKPYLRLAHAWATPSNVGDIIRLEAVGDHYNNQFSSLFYGYPLADELIGLDIQSYITPGFIQHWSSDVQDSGQEFVLALKSYYTFRWPVNWRFGVAEGLSYVDNITYIEAKEMEEKGLEPSRWLLYLDFSFDLELGDLFNYKPLTDLWLGYAIHHRSGIFGDSSMFGDIEGGSNYNSLYLQYHF
jgi:outer membrane protein